MAQRTDGRSDWIGLRVARWRDIAGMTQQDLADAVGVSREYVSMIENGRRAVTKRSLLIALARALRVSITDLTAQPMIPRTREESWAYLIAPAIRQVVDGQDDPPDPRPSGQLAELADRAMSARMAGDWPVLGDVLPGLLAETAVAAETGGGRDLALHVQACAVAGMALKPLGFLDLARLLATRAQTTAALLDDPVLRAAADFVAAQIVLAGGSRRRSLEIAEDAVEQLPLDGEDARAWAGMLHLQAALTSASLGDGGRAQDHLRAADDLAPTVAGDPWHMEFGAANVATWRVGVALENGEPDRAPELARRVDPTSLRTPDRRARLHIDTARGWFAGGDHVRATRALLEADTIAPRVVRTRPVVREIAGQMIRDSATHRGSAEMRDLVSRLGIDPLAPPDVDQA
jgi:transcriptional regulator with XRE-family HTH domain